MIVSNAALKNRITVLVLVLLIVLAGVYSYATLPRESAPDVPIPYVLVSTIYRGVSPEDVESAVTMKIEKKLTGIKGVKEVRSSSQEGMSVVMVEFQPDVRVEDAIQLVRDKVDQAKGDLPTDENFVPPVVTEINIAEFPIIIYSISGRPPEVLKPIADKIKDAIEQNVPGVLNVDIVGAPEREIRLELDPQLVASYNLTLPEILALVPGENVNVSAGGLETPRTKFNVRVPSQYSTAQDLQDINHRMLAMRGGSPIYLQDVGQVVDTFKDRTSYSRLNGASSITLSIQKRVGANIVDIAQGVSKVIEEARKRAPQGVQFVATMDRSEDIDLMVKDLENNIGAALVLVLAVLLVSIGLRASLIVALAVPLSMLMSFAILDMMGYTLNMIVLFSLVLAVGMLVDDAIVIVENVYRHMQMGYGRMDAAVKGTAEVAWPVITSTLTTCAAFLPLVFWPGVMGSFLKYLPITLIIVLLSSLFVALVVSPVVCTLIPGKASHRDTGSMFLRGYRRVLGVAVSHRVTTLLLCGLVLVGMVVLYAKKGAGMEFFPKTDPKHVVINIRTPQGRNIKDVDKIAWLVERRLDHLRKDFDYLVTEVGRDENSDNSGAAAFSGTAAGPNEAGLTVIYPDYEDRKKSSVDSIVEIRQAVAGIPGAEIKVQRDNNGPPTGAAVTVRLIGEDMKTLETLDARARKMIANVPGLVNLRSDLEMTRPELVFRVDRNRALLAGVNPQIIGTFLQTAIFGKKVGTYRQFNDEYDITIRLPESSRTRIDDLERLQIPAGLTSLGAKSIPLSSLGEFKYAGGLGTISRVNQKRVVTLTGDAEGRLDYDVLGDVMNILSPSGRTKLVDEDILDWDKFLGHLRRGEDAASRRIMTMLDSGNGGAILGMQGPKDKRAALAAIRSGETLNEAQKHNVLAGVNVVLADAAFYDDGAFGALAFGDEGHKVHQTIAQTADASFMQADQKAAWKQATARLNRMVMESSLPGVVAKAPRIDLPDNYDIKYAGQNEESEKAQSFLLRAFVIALILITLIMVAQFNTLSAPGIIMTTVVLSFIGVLIGLMVCQIPFGIIMTGIGVISLAGVVVKNGIVLMAYTRQLQERGMDVVSACIEAGATRLRPVLLTACCTVLGLVPTALGWSFDFHTFQWHWKSEASEMWKSMAVALVFGLTFATILTLVVVPSLYVLIYKAAAKLGLGGIRKDKQQAEEDSDEEPAPLEMAEAK